jgi:ferredoxin-thioredoxin reductase catalytic subunit
MASRIDMVACPTSDLGHKVVVGMHIDMAHMGMGWRCPCRYFRS